MEINMKGNGKIIRKMVKEFSQMLMERIKNNFGRMANNNNNLE
jgi:hypothetical protein